MPYKEMQIFCVFEKSYAKKRKKILYLCIQDYVMHTKNVLENGFFSVHNSMCG